MQNVWGAFSNIVFFLKGKEKVQIELKKRKNSSYIFKLSWDFYAIGSTCIQKMKEVCYINDT